MTEELKYSIDFIVNQVISETKKNELFIALDKAVKSVLGETKSGIILLRSDQSETPHCLRKLAQPSEQKVSVSVVSGDITQVKADALITAINSGRVWFGGIDQAIMRVAGKMFHLQAAKSELEDGQTVIALSNGHHDGAFTNVVFVVDDLKRPLRAIVYNGLKAAANAGFESVSLPTIRTGVMLGMVERDLEETTDEMAKGIKNFLAENPASALKNIVVAVYNDKLTEHLLRNALK